MSGEIEIERKRAALGIALLELLKLPAPLRPNEVLDWQDVRKASECGGYWVKTEVWVPDTVVDRELEGETT